MAEIMDGIRIEYERDYLTNRYIFKKEIKIEILRTPMISKGTYENMLLNQLGKVDLLREKSNDNDYPSSLMKYLHIFYKEESYMFYVISEYFESGIPLELRNVEPLILFTYVSRQLLDAFEYLTKIGIFTCFLTIVIDEKYDIKISDFGLIHALNEVNNESSIESNICIDYAKDYLSLNDHYSLTMSPDQHQEQIYRKKEEVYYPWIYALIMINKATQQMLKESCGFEIRATEGEYWHEASLLVRCYVLYDEENILDYSQSYKSQCYRIKQMLEQFENKPQNEVKNGNKEEEINIRLLQAQPSDFKDEKNKLQPWLTKSLEFFEKNVLKPYRCRSKLSEIREFFHREENWIMIESIKESIKLFSIEHEKEEKEETNLLDELRYFIDFDILSKMKGYELYQMVAVSMNSTELKNAEEFSIIKNSTSTISSTKKEPFVNVLNIYENFQYEKKMIQFACYASHFRLLIKMCKKINSKLPIAEQKWKEEQQKQKKSTKKVKQYEEKIMKAMKEMLTWRETIWKEIKSTFLLLKNISVQINESNLETFLKIKTFDQLRSEIVSFVKLIEEILKQVNEELKQIVDDEQQQVRFREKIESLSNDQLYNIKEYAKCVFVDFAHFFNIKIQVLVLHLIRMHRSIILKKFSEQEIRLLLSCADNLTSDLMAGIFGNLVYDYSTSSSSPLKVKLNSLKLLTLIEAIIHQNRGFQSQVQKLSREPFIENTLINLKMKKYMLDMLYQHRLKKNKYTEDTEDYNDTGGEHSFMYEKHDDKVETNDS